MPSIIPKFEDGLSVTETEDGARVDRENPTARWETDKEVAFLDFDPPRAGNDYRASLNVVKRKLNLVVE